jgi:hypothetical protein
VEHLPLKGKGIKNFLFLPFSPFPFPSLLSPFYLMTKFLVSRLIFMPALILPVLLNFQTLAAELVGRAVLPADTFAPGPTTGQFKNTNRTVPLLMHNPYRDFLASS